MAIFAALILFAGLFTPLAPLVIAFGVIFLVACAIITIRTQNEEKRRRKKYGDHY